MNKGGRAKNLNLSLMALFLLCTGYLGLVLFSGSFSPLLLVSGTSMEPAFHAGDLLLNKTIAATEIKVGDVIAFNMPEDARQRLGMPPKAAHRVIGIEGISGELFFATKGDNSDADSFKVSSSEVLGVVSKNLGPWGRPLLFVANTKRLLIFGLPVITFLLIVVGSLWYSSNQDKQHEEQLPGPTTVTEIPSAPIDQSLNLLASAVSEYGIHLKSHTAVVKNLSGATQELRQVTRDQSDTSTGLNDAVNRQNEVLANLVALIGKFAEQAKTEKLEQVVQNREFASLALEKAPERENPAFEKPLNMKQQVNQVKGVHIDEEEEREQTVFTQTSELNQTVLEHGEDPPELRAKEREQVGSSENIKLSQPAQEENMVVAELEELELSQVILSKRQSALVEIETMLNELTDAWGIDPQTIEVQSFPDILVQAFAESEEDDNPEA